jgi:hypothetical protein
VKRIEGDIPGYSYQGDRCSAVNIVGARPGESEGQLGFTDEDQGYLRLAGEVPADQTRRSSPTGVRAS